MCKKDRFSSILFSHFEFINVKIYLKHYCTSRRFFCLILFYSYKHTLITMRKMLSHDKLWRREADFLVRVYKVLTRSVLDYANVISAACTKRVKGVIKNLLWTMLKWNR